MLHLLEKGLPWDIIHNMSTDGINKVLGVLGAIREKQQQDQDAVNRQMTSHVNSRR